MKVGEVWNRHAPGLPLAVPKREGDEPLGVAKKNGLQPDGVEDAVERRRGADAERNRENGHRRQERSALQRPDREHEVHHH
jgi:hypothetical protein